MPLIWVQTPVETNLLESWKNSFPMHTFLVHEETLSPQQAEEVVIIFGNSLPQSTLERMPRLQWIHSPTSTTSELCWDAIRQRETIVVTKSDDENTEQKAEFIQGAVLAFAKNLFDWKESLLQKANAQRKKNLRESMWSLQGRIHIQIGLGKVGTAIAERARRMGMTVWGVRTKRSFHPLCHKTFAWSDLHSILPSADVVCFYLESYGPIPFFLTIDELALMQNEVILVILGKRNVVDEERLKNLALAGKFRGLVWDTLDEDFDAMCKEWKEIPRLLLSPGICAAPESPPRQAGKIFTFNLRQFMQKNWIDMKNVIYPRVLPQTV